MDEITKHTGDVEIVELDERLDMAFDPITLWLAASPDLNIGCTQTQCANSVSGCCCG